MHALRHLFLAALAGLATAALLLASGCSGGTANDNTAGGNGKAGSNASPEDLPYAKLGVQNKDGICPVTGKRVENTDHIVMDKLKRKWLVAGPEAADEFLANPEQFIGFANGSNSGHADNSGHDHGHDH